MNYSTVRLWQIVVFGLVLNSMLRFACSANAQIVAPSTYTTSIRVQGEVAGTEFDDWAASGIPVVTMDPVDNPGDLDIANVQIANDKDFLYIHATTHSPNPIALVNLFLAFDTDRNKATGFDILQIGELGSEVGYQTDYPFAQYAGVFNLNISLTGGPVNNGGALIYPYWVDASGPTGTQIEWAVPRNVLIQYPPALGGPSPTFPNSSFDFVIYTPTGLADITEVITYTFANAPAGVPGDYNGNLVVDAADYTIWRDTLGSTTDLRANGDNTGASAGVIDQADFNFWKASFGGLGAGAVAAVPEPTAGLLMALAMCGCGLLRRR